MHFSVILQTLQKAIPALCESEWKQRGGDPDLYFALLSLRTMRIYCLTTHELKCLNVLK